MTAVDANRGNDERRPPEADGCERATATEALDSVRRISFGRGGVNARQTDRGGDGMNGNEAQTEPAKHALTAEGEGRVGSVGLELRHFNRSCGRGKDAGAGLTWAWLAAWLRGHGANWEIQRLATNE